MAQDRIVVFVDYQNVFATARRCFHQPRYRRSDGQIDPLALGELLVARRRRPSVLTEVRVFRGLPDRTREPMTHAANLRQVSRWTRSPVVHVVQRPLRYPRKWPVDPAQEKGVDVALAVDFVRLAAEGAYDAAILMSTDTDLLPALEAVVAGGVHVEVAAWAGPAANRRLSLGHDLPWCHHLRRGDYLAVHDPTDYGSP